MRPEILEVKLSRYQREFLWKTLKEEKWGLIKEDAKEIREIYKKGIERYIKGIPEYSIFQKYPKCFRTVSRICLPDKLVENIHGRAINRIHSEHSDWRTLNLYELDSTLKYDLDLVVVFDDLNLPHFSCISLFNSSQFYDLGVFTKSEIFMLEEKLEELAWKIIEINNLGKKYESDAGNKFGKIATWGELKIANPAWFDIIYNKYAESSEVKESVKAIEEETRIKKGKSVVLNDTLAELRDLAKKCNLIK